MMELADRIYMFCLEEDRGIMFYDQSPEGAVANFSGLLPNGVFLSSGEQLVYWDDKINGVKPSELGKEMNFVSRKVKYKDGEYTAKTIFVSKETFIDVLLQIKDPEMIGYYKKIDILRLLKNKANNLNNSKKQKK